jgi:two-component system response regulator MtrA
VTALEADERLCSVDVLLVEDDTRLARALALSLADTGDHVRVAANAAQARAQLGSQEPDVVLLDLGLPDEDGLVLCTHLRAASDVPIIIVTARGDTDQVIAGLRAGADDYVRKPVTGSELSARIQALLRRTRRVDMARPPIRAGDVEIDVRHGSARRDGDDLHLTHLERQLLRELALRAGETVTREELLERVWGYQYFGDTRLLDVHIRRLRTKVELDPSSPRLVVTVRGLGYRLEC